ncbi:Polycystin-2, partial [Acropora cervicornis]
MTTALAVFFSILKFLRLLKFNLFGIDNDDYSSFPSTLGSVMSLTLGSFHFNALTDSSRILGPIFFFGFVVCVHFVLMNVFIGILNDALVEVANDSSVQSNEHEILDFIFHTFKKTVGKQVGSAITPSYKEPKNQFELNMDSIEEMSENIQYAMRNICMEDIRHSTWFEPENANIKKKILMMLVLETDHNFTENDLCDSIPLFDEEMKQQSENQLIRKLISYRKKKRKWRNKCQMLGKRNPVHLQTMRMTSLKTTLTMTMT